MITAAQWSRIAADNGSKALRRRASDALVAAQMADDPLRLLLSRPDARSLLINAAMSLLEAEELDRVVLYLGEARERAGDRKRRAWGRGRLAKRYRRKERAWVGKRYRFDPSDLPERVAEVAAAYKAGWEGKLPDWDGS